MARVLALGAALWGSLAAGAEPAAEKVFQTCVACHGPRGEGQSATHAPAIAGLPARYVERQLRAFRSGLRGADPADAVAASMRAAVLALKDDEVSSVAAHASTLPKAPEPPTLKGDGQLGRSYFNAICSACHGSDAKGNAVLESPPLAGRSDAYLLRQFRLFRAGARGARADDVYGRQMRHIIRAIPQSADQSIIVYAASLER